MITEQSYTEARKAIEGLRTASGIDLTGYEHLWAAVAPLPTIAAMMPGEICVAVDGQWISLGVARDIHIAQDTPAVEISSFGSLSHQYAVGVKSTTMRAEIPLTTAAWDWLQRNGAKTFNIRLATGQNGAIVETMGFLERADTPMMGGSSLISIHVVIVGAATLHNP